MKAKKLISMMLVAAMTVTVLAGCSSGKEETDGEKNKEVTVTAMVAQSRNYDGLQKMVQKLKEEENITIDMQVVPDDQYLNLMKMKVNSGEAPDMIDYNLPGIFYEIDPEANFIDLTEESWTKDLVAPENIEYNGKIYGYPFQSVQGVMGFVYNKDVFDELGIKEPSNWDEFLQVCEEIKTKGDGVVPIHIPKDTWVPQTYMTSNFAAALGPDKAKEVGQKLEANELKWTEVPEFEEVLDKYLDLFQKGYVNEDFTSTNYDGTIEAVGTGKAAMAFNGDFFANSVLEAFPDANLGMFSVSMVGNSEYIPATTASIGFVGNKNSENADVVKHIFELWSTPEYGNLYFENRPGFPALSTIDGGETPDYLTGIKEKYIDTGKTVTEFNSCLTVGYNIIPETMWLYYLDAPAKGETSGAAILEKFQGDFEKYMKEMKQPGF